jgi:hypothetical protein
MLLASLIVALPLAYAAAPSASFAANGDITFAPTEAWADVKDGRTLSDGVNPVISMSTTAGSSATFTLAGDNLNFSLFGQKATNQGLHTISLDGTESEIDFFRPDPGAPASIASPETRREVSSRAQISIPSSTSRWSSVAYSVAMPSSALDRAHSAVGA